MWTNLPLENKMRDALEDQFPGGKWESYYGNYTKAKDYLIKNIYTEIQCREPNLSKHESSHIQNVLENAGMLLGNDINKINGIGLYFLCLSILFHDVGMIKGRVGHNDRKLIAEIYNKVRNNSPEFNQERSLLIKTCEAHCGTSRNGSKDTLKEIDKIENLDGHSLIARELSAILRLSDELAEGPQRTSQYMNETHGYEEDSKIYHDYASITNVFIDKGNERIALTYHLDILEFEDLESFSEMLRFIYLRIIKLDEERGYNKYYSNFLLPFKRTSAKFNFLNNGIPLEFEVDSIELTDDFPIPDQKKEGDKMIEAKYPEYKITKLFDELKKSNGNI
jgi:hypothetical protein